MSHKSAYLWTSEHAGPAEISQQGLPDSQVVAVDDQIVAQARLLAQPLLALRQQLVEWHGQMMVVDPMACQEHVEEQAEGCHCRLLAGHGVSEPVNEARRDVRADLPELQLMALAPLEEVADGATVGATWGGTRAAKNSSAAMHARVQASFRHAAR